MNRQLLRKIKRSGLTKADIKQFTREVVYHTTSAYESALILSLHDKLGFGHKRIINLLTQIRDTFDCIEQGYVDLEDIKGDIKLNLKIDVDKDFD